MAIPRTSKKADAVTPASRVAPRVPVLTPYQPQKQHNVVIPSSASVLRKHSDEDTMAARHAANQWGDDHVDDAQQALKGVVLEGTVSQVAVLNRELKALETRYFRTREQLDKVNERSDALRAEMAKCRAESDKRARENAKLRHLVDRIQSEKKQAEQHAISNRDYAQKIEQKFFVGVPKAQTQTLVHCNLELTARVKAQEREIAEHNEMIQSQLSELKAANDKVAILKRALETRFEELQLNGSLHNGVLFELAKLQDQNASMALQLGEERKSSKALEAKLEHARAKHVELEEHLVVRETWLASLETERVELGEKLAACENDRATFAFEKATLLKFIQEQAESKFLVEAELKRVQEAKVAELEAFHARLQLAMDEKQKLQDTINELLVKLEKAQLESQALDRSWRAEQSTTDELRRRQHEMFLDIQRLQEDFKRKDDECRAAVDVGRQRQEQIDTLQHEEQLLKSKIDELEAIITALEQEIVQRKDEEAALRVAMENALRDLDTLSKQRNEAARAMNEAVVISASSLDEQQALEAKVETQRKQLEQLKHAKNLLQSAMLEQLSALRKQLQTERLQRIEAEAKLKQRGAGASSGREPPQSSSTSGSDEVGGYPTPVTPTPSYDSEHLQPLPPPEISLPSPLPPQFQYMLHRHANVNAQRVSKPRSLSSRSSSSSSVSEAERDLGEHGSPPRQPVSSSAHSYQLSERAAPSSIPSPSDNLSLLELAGDI